MFPFFFFNLFVHLFFPILIAHSRLILWGQMTIFIKHYQYHRLMLFSVSSSMSDGKHDEGGRKAPFPGVALPIEAYSIASFIYPGLCANEMNF